MAGAATAVAEYAGAATTGSATEYAGYLAATGSATEYVGTDVVADIW